LYDTGVTMSSGYFVWHDLYSPDAEKARRFYTDLLGWRYETSAMEGMDYVMAWAGDAQIGGVNGFMPGQPPLPRWISYISTDNLEKTQADIAAQGGIVDVPAFEVPGVGSMAYCRDPYGASFAAFEAAGPGNPAPWPPRNPAPGMVVWHDVMSPEVPAAASFYAGVFGWVAVDWTNPKFACFGLRKNDTTAAVVVGLPGPDVPITWTVYFEANGTIDEMIARTAELGGLAITGKMHQPGFGDFAIIEDPTGGVFGIVKSEMWLDNATEPTA